MLTAALIIFAVTGQQPPVAAPPIDRSMVPQCAISTDPNYGVTRSSPVEVGGGPMYGPARERRYLDALRGPDGQPTHDGLTKPIVLYIDEYHFTEPRAPAGFVCGQPIGLEIPPPDPIQASTSLVSVAIEQGSVRDFPPIPLDQDGATTHGVVFDQFRMIARTARAAAAAGTRMDPKPSPGEIARPRTVVLAYPLSCSGRTVAPAAIDILGAQGAAIRREGEYSRDAAIGALLPGMQAPVSSLAATFALTTLRPTDTVRITYAEASCTGGTPDPPVLPRGTRRCGSRHWSISTACCSVPSMSAAPLI